MRRLPFAALLVAALPAPALAQEAAAEPSASAIAQMADPATQEQVALMAQALGEMLLDMPVAPLLDAAKELTGEDRTGVDPDARVADLVGPEARDMPAEMAQRIPVLMRTMATLAGSLEAMAPRLREIADRMPRSAE